MADDLGTAPDDGQDPPAGTDVVAPGATDQQAPPVVEEFISPQDLPAEVLPHFKRMQAAYTKKMQALAGEREKVALVDQFRSNPEFARQLIEAEARRLGLNLQAPPSAQTQPAQNAGPGAPPALVESIKANLSPELHWMAKELATSAWLAAQEATRPLTQRSQQADQQARLNEYGALTQQLAETAPGWEAHEQEMADLHAFLKSDAMTHPRFGSKLSLLYRAVTGDAAAVRVATQRMSEAGRSASRTGQVGRSSVPNITDRVRKASTNAEAWEVARQHALEEARKQGLG